MAKVQSSAAVRAPSPPQPVKSGRKSDQVFEQISSSIRSGRFPAGARLPAERDLVTMFKTSRQTIREAIYRAELIGLIEVRHGAGSFVIASEPQAADKPVGELIKIEAGKVGELFEIRRALEGWCASAAAKVGSKPHLDAMKARLDAMSALDVGTDEWEEHDVGFHAAIAAATGNPLAVRMMDMLRDSFWAYFRLKRFIPTREETARIWQLHAEVYDAVRARSPDRARAAIIAHMDFVEAKLAESLEQFDAGEQD